MSNLARLLRPGTDGDPGTEAGRSAFGWRVGAWIAVVGLMAALSYAARATSGTPDRDVLYKSSTAAYTIFQDAILLIVVLAVAGSLALAAVRNPRSWPRSLGLAVLVLIVIAIVVAGLESVLHGGEEQGLTPEKWDPTRAGAYTLNFVVLAAVVPIVEEITFRGVGYSLLSRWGTPVAIAGSALAFGLAHGLVEGLPALLVFGLGLGWLRSRTGSIIPGIAVHATFNAISLIAAVTT